ncbi:MAG TPA: hypothetical protein VK203_23165 [Nostocaceae cyanobacterium]|nr:hypothetical protein [Nostocaceae cyanobacterium]
MSEYQYYEFQALDKRLTPSEQDFINTLSSRVQLTPTTAIFTYSYSDFRGEPKDLLIRCFDIMLYIANWGTRQLMFRLPLSLVDLSALEEYSLPNVITIEVISQYVVIDILIDDEENSDWVEGEGWLSKLARLRDDILQGDFRALYLAWLKAAPMLLDIKEIEEDAPEPAVPANLQNLSNPLQSLVEFFNIDQDLITAAAINSCSSKKQEVSLEKYIPALSEAEKIDFLTRLIKDEPLVSVQLAKRLQELSKNNTRTINSENTRRSLSELLTNAKNQTKIRQKQEAQAAKEAKIRRLEALAPKQDQIWKEVFRLIELKQAKPYDEAVAHLVDLRDLAEYQGKLSEFYPKIYQIENDYSKRSGLISRLAKVGLISR